MQHRPKKLLDHMRDAIRLKHYLIRNCSGGPQATDFTIFFERQNCNCRLWYETSD